MISHDQLIQDTIAAAAAVRPEQVARAFAASLGTRRLDWRSALGSLAAVQHLYSHPFQARSEKDPGRCAVCGLGEGVALDRRALDRLRAEQHFLVRFYNVAYACADLQAFPGLQIPDPTSEDLAHLRALFEALRTPGLALGELNGAIRGGFKSNKNQRAYLLEALAIAGILCPQQVPSFETRWVGYQELEFELSARHHYAKDSAYPLRHWSRSSRLNEAALTRWFGTVLSGP